MPDALKCPEIDDDIDERILIGNGLAVAEVRTLNAQIDGLRVDAFGGGSLLVDLLILRALTIQLIAQASPDADGQGADTAAFGPIFVGDWA